VGNWTGTSFSDSIQINADGSFSYRGEGGCLSKGSFACPDASSTAGTIKVSIDSSVGANCLPVGDTTCEFSLNGNTMSFNWGAGTLQYRR
jgi:hypothetical protein